MSFSTILILLPIIAFCAFFLKGLTGFGPALIIVPATSLLLPPHLVVVLSSILDLIAGIIMQRKHGLHSNYGFVAGLVIAMFIGTLLGVYIMSLLPAQLFRQILGFMIMLLALGLYLERKFSNNLKLRDNLPAKCQGSDICAGLTSGLFGGIVAVGGPPVIWHFGRKYKKEIFRNLLVTFFLASSVTRLAGYSIFGIGSLDVFYYVLAALPGLILGIYFGNRGFIKISENKFNSVVCGVLVVLGVSLVLK